MSCSVGYQIQSNGRFIEIPEERHIRSCLRALLLTHLGERRRYPNIGTSLVSVLSRQMNVRQRAEISEKLIREISASEPRIDIESLEIVPVSNASGEFKVKIDYRTKKTKALETFDLEVA